MQILNKITVENFRCFRKKEEFLFSQGTYLIGINNAGKTAVLNAIRFFFEDNLYTDETFLNRTEFVGKAAGYNRSRIEIEFNINAIRTKSLKQRLSKKYGESVSVKKTITITEVTKNISILYEIRGEKYTSEKLPEDINKVIKGIKITYIHPQEGKDLLINAQGKLRLRLLANWGRNYTFVTQSLKDIESNWGTFRQKAKKYLSESLSESIQNMWPGSEVSIELPKTIEEIIAISDITFRGSSGPEIELISQGTGAQSTILYLTHYLLDSDRSLHRGEYYPIWLLEEPESFLHANLALQFSKELNSDSWLENIQMIISTHSPLILAGSRLGGEKIRWDLLENYTSVKTGLSTKWQEDDIQKIGKIMGDSNFYFYFLASTGKKLIFIEDEREITVQKFREAGIDVLKGLKGVTEVARYIDVFSSTEEILNKEVFFIIDGDHGKRDLSRYLTNKISETDGFIKYKVTEKVFIICFPDNYCAESLFNEYENYLEECVNKLYNTDSWLPSDSVPGNLSRAHAEIRGKSVSDKDQAKLVIKNTQDVKDSFWNKVKDENLKLGEEVRRIKELTR